MDTDSITQLILIIILLALSAFFSSAETAFTTVNHIRIRTLIDEGNKRAVIVSDIIAHSQKMLSAILIGNNIVNISASALATSLTIKIWGNYATGITTGVLTIVVLIFGEITPKTTATVYSEKFALVYAPVIKALMTVLTPVIYVVDVLAGFFLRLFHIDTKNHKKTITETELRTFVNVSHEEGVIESDERQIINNLFDFGDAEAKDVMIPRIDMVAADITTGYDEILALFRETMYSRIPVYEEEQDNVVGILYHKDFYNYVNNSDMTIREAVKPVLFTTKHKNISELLKELQVKHMHIAVIVDEFGCTVGILTLEDILEELVGEIWDEHDEVVREVEPLSENVYRVSGKTNVERLFESLGYEQEFDVQTVSGWIMELLERIPEAGDTVDYRNMHLTVESMKEKRVDTVRLEISPESQSA